MSDEQSIQLAVVAFYNLSGDNTTKLKELNAKIQDHTGEWGVRRGGEKNASGTIQMPWIQLDPLIGEFIDFMDGANLLPVFAWTKWDEGSKLFTSEDPAKYDNIDLVTALKLISTTIRKERFADGTLAWAFESGGFPKLVSRLLVLAETDSRLE